jgi:hypothetical protein
MFMLLKVGEVWLIISAIAFTFYIMIGMQMTDQGKLPKQNYNRLRLAVTPSSRAPVRTPAQILSTAWDTSGFSRP